MRTAAEYLAYVKALVVSCPAVEHVAVVREESQGHSGLFRYRLTLCDGGLLEMFEHFKIEADEVMVLRYRHHWQDAMSVLRKRWDNAPHHEELSTFPNHVHDGDDSKALPHQPVTAAEVLALVADKAGSDTAIRQAARSSLPDNE